MTILSGHRILVVEDEPIIALNLESMLIEAGAEVIGPAMTVAAALQLAMTPGLTSAIVDLRLQNQSAHPIIECLLRHDIPFALHSGQTEMSPESSWPDAPVLKKPANEHDITAVLAGLRRPVAELADTSTGKHQEHERCPQYGQDLTNRA